MVRAALLALALFGSGPTRPDAVDYRLDIEAPTAGRPPVLNVTIRLRGDASGETKLDLPDQSAGAREAWRYISDLKVDGASVTAPDAAHRVLRHRPGAKLTVRYRVQSAYHQDPDGADGAPLKGPLLRPGFVAALGPFVFARPEGREAQPMTFQWGKLPKGWRAASDLEHAAQGRAITVADARSALVLAAPTLQVAEQATGGGPLRLAFLGVDGLPTEAIAKDAAMVTGVERAFWNDMQVPYLVGIVGLTETKGAPAAGGMGLKDALALFASPNAKDRLAYVMTREGLRSWMPAQLGTGADADAFSRVLGEGFTDFLADRMLLRTGLETAAQVVERMDGQLYGYDRSPVRTAPGARVAAEFRTNADVAQLADQRGFLLALKWDEMVRLKTGGRADLGAVLRRMRDHAGQFATGQAPDLTTGFVSAMWVEARIDIRPEIARYVDQGAAIDLPEEMFGGCLQARVTVSPAFDPGFDTTASFAAKTLKGVRRGGPAWVSGLRDGMALDSWAFTPGDTTRQIELMVRGGPGKAARQGKPRRVAFWPYGDADASKRKLQLTPGMSPQQVAACGKRMAGL
jgi:predicted metalloprotease with PDZ domain